MTIHGSKSELEWLRYHENRDDASIDASVTSESQNFWSDCWISKFHTFSEIGSQDFSRGFRISPISGLLKLAVLEGPSPRNACRGYKYPQAPLRLRRKTFLWFFALFLVSLHVFLYSKHQKTHIKHPKSTSNPLDSSFFTNNTRYCLYTQSSFPWFYTLDLGFRVMDVAFLAIIHTPNLLNVFLAFILLFLLE